MHNATVDIRRVCLQHLQTISVCVATMHAKRKPQSFGDFYLCVECFYLQFSVRVAFIIVEPDFANGNKFWVVNIDFLQKFFLIKLIYIRWVNADCIMQFVVAPSKRYRAVNFVHITTNHHSHRIWASQKTRVHFITVGVIFFISKMCVCIKHIFIIHPKNR